MSVGDAVESMAGRLARTAQHFGLSNRESAQIDAAFRLAMLPRLDLPEPAPQRLHPARTVLILLHDLEQRDARVLAAGALTETMDEALAVPLERVHRDFDPQVGALVGSVPGFRVPDDERLEQLLLAPPAVLQIALAEQLDHARHLHLYPPGLWNRHFALVQAVYLPMAERTGGIMARRLRRWHDRFQQRVAAA